MMKHSLLVFALALLAALWRPGAHAQSHEVLPGDRVRVTALRVSIEPIVGRVARLSSDSLVLDLESREAPSRLTMASRGWQLYQEHPGALKLPLDAIERLEVRRGQKTHIGEGLIGGALVGGLIIGLVVYADENRRAKEYERQSMDRICGFLVFDCLVPEVEPNPGAAFVAGAAVGVLGGAAVGALIGRSIRSDRWQQVPLDVSLSLWPMDMGVSQPDLAFSIRLSLNGKRGMMSRN